MRSLTKALLVAVLTVLGSQPAGAASCTTAGLTSPITDMNVNNLFPISVAGQTIVTAGGARNCSAIKSAGTTCLCPGRLFGLSTPGIMMTMHLPTYVAEVQGEAGCSPLLGSKLTSAYDHRSTASDNPGASNTGDDYSSTRQVHWLEYPVFSLLEILKDSICLHSGSVLDIAYATEFDSLRQTDPWAAVVAPQPALFANYAANSACVIDTVSASFTRCPIDAMPWCVGKASSYPWSATQYNQTDHTEGSMKVLQKFLQRQTRFGLLRRTVGSDAQCSPVISPVMARSQWRVDLIHPNPRRGGKPVVLGTDNHVMGTPGAVPFDESTVFLIWQGMQCCLHI